jgi:hypothetical protein
MDTQFRRGLSFVLCGLALGLTLACAMPGSSGGGGGGQDVATPESSGGETTGSGGSEGCDYPTDDFVDVAGTYSVEGGKTDQSGDKYTATLTIANTGQNCFSASWAYGDGRTRTGTLQMVGNIIDGHWQEGDQKGTFGGTASTDRPIASWWGREGGDDTEYSEVWTKQ